MCGVFGYVSQDDQRPNLQRLQTIAENTERRGPHAFGFAWVDSRGRLRSYKQTGRITESMGMLAMAADARMLIGHCRYATQGDPENNLNNHPFACDGGWIVHNGVIADYTDILERHDLYANTDCDSETLALLIEALDGTLPQRCGRAVAEIASPRAAVVLGLWTHPMRLIAVRRGNPLCWGRAKSGIYMASLPGGLPSNRRDVKDGNVLEFRIGEGEIRIHAEEIPSGGACGDLAEGTVERVCPAEADAEPKGETAEVRRGCWFK